MSILYQTLWIARKSLYLWYSEQPGEYDIYFPTCCELLAKVCIFDILNNNYFKYVSDSSVVNCSQKFVSLIFWTTQMVIITKKEQLWIARKSLYLWYSEQLCSNVSFFWNGCELLAKVCIFDILNNKYQNRYPLSLVVNCSQKFVSLIFWTTSVPVYFTN